jgi:hypothetical protein
MGAQHRLVADLEEPLTDEKDPLQTTPVGAHSFNPIELDAALGRALTGGVRAGST